MGSAQDFFVNLYKSDKAYRAWFKKWWAADFSHAGRNRRHLNIGHVDGGTFAGRSWTRGWAPPHDLDGRPNDAFIWLQESSTRQHWWQYIRTDLAGAFIKGINTTALSTSSVGLEFCFLEGDVTLDTTADTADYSNIFVTGSVSISQRFTKVALVGARIFQDLTLSSSRSIQYDISSAVIGGSVRIDGPDVDGTAKGATIRGNMNVKGGINGSNIRVGDLILNQTVNQSHSRDAILPYIRARNIKISGPYGSTDLKNGRIRSLEISTKGGISLTAALVQADSIKIGRDLQSVDIENAKIRNDVEFRDISSNKIDLSGIVAKSLRGSGVRCRSFNFSGAHIGSDVSFDKCQFGEQLSAPGAVFEGPVSFARCALTGGVNFAGAHFHKGAIFKVGSGSEVAADATFKQIGEADFSGAKFEPGQDEVCANFDGRQTLEAANFEGSRFSGVPMFYECEFHENISFRGAIFDIERPNKSYLASVAELDWAKFVVDSFESYSFPLQVDGIRMARAWYVLRKPLSLRRSAENHRLSRYERAYNALRQRFAEVGNAKYERQFHNYELRARRRRIDADAPLVEGVVSLVYDGFSKYGQSISRPLWILFIFWMAFGLIYFLMAGIQTFDSVVESGVFSARQVVKPFSAWSRDFALSASPASAIPNADMSPWIRDLMGIGLGGEVLRATTVRVLATIQSFLSLVLIFLSGLAVRRTFGVG